MNNHIVQLSLLQFTGHFILAATRRRSGVTTHCPPDLCSNLPLGVISGLCWFFSTLHKGFPLSTTISKVFHARDDCHRCSFSIHRRRTVVFLHILQYLSRLSSQKQKEMKSLLWLRALTMRGILWDWVSTSKVCVYIQFWEKEFNWINYFFGDLMGKGAFTVE